MIPITDLESCRVVLDATQSDGRWRGCIYRNDNLVHTVQAKSEPNAYRVAASWVKENRGRLGISGPVMLRALETHRSRLAGITHSNEARNNQWCVVAVALGVSMPRVYPKDAASRRVIRREWLERIDARIDVVRRFVKARSLAGPLGRPNRQYILVSADPPWLYRDQGSRAAPGYEGTGRAQARYAPIPDPEICDLGVELQTCLASAAILALWVPSSILAAEPHRHLAICEAWGFRPPAALVPWIKTTKDKTRLKIGMGHYGRVVTEYLALACRGDLGVSVGGYLALAPCGRATMVLPGAPKTPQIIFGPSRSSMHSSKPIEAYEFLEALVGPHAAKLELFARPPGRNGWDVWGDEAGDR